MMISVVVPVRNEMDNVAALIVEIHQALSHLEAYEMIFIDDGSTDETRCKLESAMQSFPTLRVLRHQHSCGQSRAIHTGVQAAQYPWIVTMDGDGQNDPADIVGLMAIIEQQANQLWMVAGYRHDRHDNWWRRFSSKVANLVRQAVLHDHTPDTGCGLKLFRRDKFLCLPYFDHMHRFLPALMQMAGGQVVSVKVKHRTRKFGISNYGTLDRMFIGIVDLLGVIWLKSRHSLPTIVEVLRG
ncbi:glycosyltransferase family 2 protein [Methylomonas sp. AM2-LC]|uniref:glycosyltransferase family 2 protein n=1 Tax=Methylomonas sp. AM2-LC TaxID=3153301 RepID=UPI003267EE1B